MDVVQDHRAEVELTRMIEKRASASNGEVDPDELEPGYMESVRRFHERTRAERRAQWIAYHECMCRLHAQLAGEHETKALKLLEESE